MFLDEARLAARVFHPNVVPTLDVVATDSELFLVMEYVCGAPLSRLVRAARHRQTRVPPAIVAGVLHGLHAAHEATDEQGGKLDIVHRDVSPQNVLVGIDGVARVLDFGVAKAAGRLEETRDGLLKGKLGYMAPEQARGVKVTRKTDIYGAAVVPWEALTGERLFRADSEANVLAKVLAGDVPHPVDRVPELPQSLSDVVMRGTANDPANRFATAREMAEAIEASIACASPAEIGAWVEANAAEELGQRAARIAAMERGSSGSIRPLEQGGYRLLSDAPTVKAVPDARKSSVRRALTLTTVVALACGFGACGAAIALLVDHGRGGHDARGALAAAPARVVVSTPASSAPEPRTMPSAFFAPSSVPVPPVPMAASTPAPTASAVTPLERLDAGVARGKAKGAPRDAVLAAKPAASDAPDCSPPFTTDELGHTHFNPDCF